MLVVELERKQLCQRSEIVNATDSECLVVMILLSNSLPTIMKAYPFDKNTYRSTNGFGMESTILHSAERCGLFLVNYQAPCDVSISGLLA